jgi:hypothetical protein
LALLEKSSSVGVSISKRSRMVEQVLPPRLAIASISGGIDVQLIGIEHVRGDFAGGHRS